VVSPFDRRGILPSAREEEKSDDFWTVNHLKLLYLISKYSHCAQTVYEKERWIRKLPMLVLLYEGIVQRVFEYDYAPASEVVETARVYVRDCTMVGAYALLLFGGDVEVDHEKGRVTMDGGWAQFSAPARIGVLIREMRLAVDKLLERHIDAPVAEGEDDLSSSPVVKAVLELLATEGL